MKAGQCSLLAPAIIPAPASTAAFVAKMVFAATGWAEHRPAHGNATLQIGRDPETQARPLNAAAFGMLLRVSALVHVFAIRRD